MPARSAVAVLLASLSFMTAITTDPPHSQTDAEKKRHAPERTLAASCGPLDRHMSSAQFELLLQTIRDAWLEGTQEKVVGCFAVGAAFSMPPSPGLVGRDSLVHVFGVSRNVEPPKRIEWHHVVFDPAQQIGAVEYTIQRRVPTHGVIIIKISHGLISNWRQYAIASDLTWEKFTGLYNF